MTRPTVYSRDDTLREIRRVGLIAVLRAPSEALALEMVEALVAGGVTGIEITYSTPNAADVVRSLDDIHGSRILLGMGTVTRAERSTRHGPPVPGSSSARIQRPGWPKPWSQAGWRR